MLSRIRRDRVGLAASALLLVSALVWAQARVIAPAAPVSATGSSSRTINVSGEAVVYVVPDEAIIRFGIESADTELAAATDANDAARRRLLKALRAGGLAEKDIQTDHEDVELVYPTGSGTWPPLKIAGYRVRRAYAVTLRDVPRLDEMLRLIVRSGANHVEGYELRTSELRKYRDEVRRKAIRAAREKATALAGELGCSVALPTSIGEGQYGWFGTYGSWWAPWGQWGNRGYNAQTQNVSYSVAGTSGSGDEPTATPVGQIGVRAQVSVTFDLASKTS
jgi:uncharacterized protein YggE